MRKDWKKKTCLILSLALCLGSSAMASEGKVAMGRYVEVPVKLPVQGYLSFTQANGAIYFVDGSGDTQFKSTDMDNWEPLETGHDEQTSPAMGGVNYIAVGADGTLYLSSGWAMQNEEGYPYVEHIKDGKSERVQLDQKLGTSSDRLPLCVLSSGELLGLSNTEAYRFSADGTTQQKYVVPGGESMAMYGNEMAICSTRNSLITVLDIESGQTLRTLPLPSAAGYGVIGYDAKGALYYVSPEGLYQVNAGDTLMIQIADGRLMSVSKPSVEAWQLLFDPENNPIIVYSDASGTSLIAYYYDEKVATEPSTILSIFTLYESDTLRQSATQFQQLNPEVMVDIIVALPQGTAITRDDAIRTLNTELLAGKGPDVVVLDGLPVQSYVEKGVLQDLSPMVQPMIDSGELQENLVGAFRKGVEIPAVPTRFLLPTIWGDVDGMKTIEDMANWAQANPDALPYYAVDVETLIGTFYLSCAPAWFAEDGRLNEEKVEAFLTAMKAIRGEWTYEVSAQKTGWDYKDVMKTMGIQMPEWNPYNHRAIGWHSMREEEYGGRLMRQGVQQQLPYLLRGADSVSLPNGMLTGVRVKDFATLPGQAEGCFLPTRMMGASKGASHSESALKFIAYSLSDEAQRADMWEGFPVNTKALDTIQAQDKMLISRGGIDWESQWINQTQRDHLRKIINALKTPVTVDFTLYQMIVTESTPFFEGKIDAKQAAQNVCAKANAYLSE